MKEINRIKKYQEFQEIFNLKKYKRNNLFTIYFRNNSYGFARVGLFVTKKNGNAVKRVKIKRQVRSIVDECLDYQKVSKDMIIVISKEYSVDMFQDNRTKLMKLIGSIQEN